MPRGIFIIGAFALYALVMIVLLVLSLKKKISDNTLVYAGIGGWPYAFIIGMIAALA